MLLLMVTLWMHLMQKLLIHLLGEYQLEDLPMLPPQHGISLVNVTHSESTECLLDSVTLVEIKDHTGILQQGLLENVNYKLHKYCVFKMQCDQKTGVFNIV